MKKFFAIVVLMFVAVSVQVQAAEYHETNESYAVTEKEGNKITDVYILGSPEKTSYGFKLYMHSVGRNHRLNKYWVLGFKMVNNDLYAVLHHGFVDDVTKQVTRGKTILSDYYRAIFQAAIDKG